MSSAGIWRSSSSNCFTAATRSANTRRKGIFSPVIPLHTKKRLGWSVAAAKTCCGSFGLSQSNSRVGVMPMEPQLWNFFSWTVGGKASGLAGWMGLWELPEHSDFSRTSNIRSTMPKPVLHSTHTTNHGTVIMVQRSWKRKCVPCDSCPHLFMKILMLSAWKG